MSLHELVAAPVAATELVEPVAEGWQLVLAALVGIGLIVGLSVTGLVFVLLLGLVI
jgi:hypothetical protein